MKIFTLDNILYMSLLACSVILASCYRAGPDPEIVAQEKKLHGQTPEVVASEREPHTMIQIQNLSLTDKTLTLEYRLSNPFEDDIWVCYDTSVYGKQEVQHAATRIDGETIRIQLRCNIERFPGFQDPKFVAKYIRLQPGESCSGRIVRSLPAKDYVREWRESRKEHKEIALHRVIFEVGYFGPKWNKFFDSISERFKKKGIKPKPKVIGSHYFLPDGTIVIEETLDGQLREVMYLIEVYTTWTRNEEFKEVVVTDVAIPCSVVVDEK